MPAATITIGSASPDKVPQHETKYNCIENNWLHNTGCEYHGASAILLVEGQHTTIAHNQINDVPHAGIVAYGDNATHGTTIANNLVINSLSVLAGGECRRIKLASQLHKRGSIYVMDEPTTGLYVSDITHLLTIMNRLVDAGNTVILIEHNLDIIRNADWVIDMGPEGSKKAGRCCLKARPRSYKRQHSR